ncbi:MAG TPA: DEAD/DEAH box helicase [Bacteroidales bacterium]|nr:DEAD/DEAH box helicase [Bacteroidales bacterium]
MNLQLIEKHYQDVSYYKKPDYLTLEEWQYALRRQFASRRFFKIENLGAHPVYSDYKVYNPETKNSYKVALRSRDNSMNFCSCNDFKTNMLGTCKHIEAVLHQVKNEPKLAKIFSNEDYQPTYTSVYLKYESKRQIRIRIGSEKQEEFDRLAGKFFKKDCTLKESSYEIFEEFIEEAAAIHPSFRCYPDALEYIIDAREEKRRKKLLRENYRKFIDNGKFDELIKAKLYPYQKEGICFASEAGKCLIADDMGLGKTIQALAAAELLKKEMRINRVVIVCPTSLKYQWKNEIEKFTGSSVLVIEGLITKRTIQYEQDAFYKIVSYHTAVNDIEYINDSNPDLVILDEAQRIKNYKTKISQNIKKLESSYKIVLSGTPIENKLEELYSIVQFVNPFTLGPFYRYMQEYRILGDNGKVIGYRNLNEIGKILSDVMIRRKRQDVLLQLPERMDKNLLVSMTTKQQEIHDDYKTQVNRIVTKWRRQGFLKEADRQRLMIFLNMMRMVCDSTYIIDQETRNDTKIDELMNILDEFIAAGNEKVVIFSQWERMTRLVAKELEARNIWFEYLHGGVASVNREVLFKNFSNEPECRVFLSTDAGGVGLNLQTASFLINLDIPWNPAVLEQRIARVYRLGQKRNVSVINMVAAGTIEHNMLKVIGFKKSMAEGVLDNGDDTIFMGDDRFKKFMESVEKMVEGPSVREINTVEDEKEEKEVVLESPQGVEEPSVKTQSETVQQTLFGDDDVPDPAFTESHIKQQETSPGDLITLGMSFLSKLTETLSNPESTQALAKSLVTKDVNGQTYLKIPVENEKIVENVMILVSGLLKNIRV